MASDKQNKASDSSENRVSAKALNNIADQASQSTQDARQALRRGGLQWTKALQEAYLRYQGTLASALADYQQALSQVSAKAWEEEFAAAADMPSAGDVGTTEMQDAIYRWRSRVTANRAEANQQMGVAGRKYAEASQRAWLDAVEKQKEANRQYQSIVEQAYKPAAAAAIPSFAVGGDEGVIFPQGSDVTWQMGGLPAWNMFWNY